MAGQRSALITSSKVERMGLPQQPVPLVCTQETVSPVRLKMIALLHPSGAIQRLSAEASYPVLDNSSVLILTSSSFSATHQEITMSTIAERLISKIDLSKYTRILPDKPINADWPVVPTPVIRIPFAKLFAVQPVTEKS
jgi:hypothetical protein